MALIWGMQEKICQVSQTRWVPHLESEDHGAEPVGFPDTPLEKHAIINKWGTA